jgi:hypothetical protein
MSPRIFASVSQDVRDQVANMATLERRSVSAMAAILIERGLTIDPVKEQDGRDSVFSYSKEGVLILDGIPPAEYEHFAKKFAATSFSNLGGLLAELREARRRHRRAAA